MTRLQRIVMLSHWKKGLHSDYYSDDFFVNHLLLPLLLV